MAETICFLIDDDFDDQEIFALALEDLGNNCQCITANSGLQALEKLRSDHSFIPDFIFLDMNMPLMSGKQCLKEIKNLSRLKEVVVIMYTTSSNIRDMEETRKLGASHYLVKPSSITELSNVLDELLQKQKLPFTVDTNK